MKNSPLSASAPTAANGLTLSFPEALAVVLREAAGVARTREEEHVALAEACGRVLASEVCADRDQPPFARSTRDGFAVHSGEHSGVHSGDLDAGNVLRVIGQVRAGEVWRGGDLSVGEAIEIMTGAPLPAGADCVLMVEHAALDEAAKTLHARDGKTLAPGANVVAQGAEARAGDILLQPGIRLRPQHIAVLAACGMAQVPVEARPRVAIVATGDELVEVSFASETPPELQQIEPWQIYNSNAPALAAAVTSAGGHAEVLATARDTLAEVRDRVMRGRSADLLLLSGGVSMGKYDLVEQVLLEEGAQFFFTGVWMQPGKPLVFGRLPKLAPAFGTERDDARRWTYFLGLPGNPVSTQVTFALFAAPLLRALCGERNASPHFSSAILAHDLECNAKLTRFLPCTLDATFSPATASVIAWQGSGDQAASARADGFVMTPAADQLLQAGSAIRVLQL
jgi:molybdopterin molybdotransferase